MIVLDEQLQGRGIEGAIAKWYPGQVQFITRVRPDTVIKDEAVPMLLRRFRRSTFVTINVTDFWRHLEVSSGLCVVCAALQDRDAHVIPTLLRRLFQHPHFATAAKRAGTVVRLTSSEVLYYSISDSRIRRLAGW